MIGVLRKVKIVLATLLIGSCFIKARPNLPADDSSNFFLQNVEGWIVEFDTSFKKEQNSEVFIQSTKAMANHLQRIRYLLPPIKVKDLQGFIIRVDLQHELEKMQYHPCRDWLIEHGFDANLEKRVHFPRAEALFERKTWLKQPYAILHELAHAYHDQVLGFEHPEIKEAYQRAEKEKLYERVLLYKGGMTSHYARTNHIEFFAEMTETYVGVNDYYPFVRAELQVHDPQTFALMKKIWGDFR